MAELRFAAWRILIDGTDAFERLRVIAIGSTVVVGTAAIGSLVYIQDVRFQGSQTAPAEIRHSARLPQPRPDEPRSTGSIKPVRSERARTSSAPERRAGIEAVSPRIAGLRTEAARIAASRADCRDGVQTEVLESRGAPAHPVVIRIVCGNGTRFYLDQDEIEMDRLSAAVPEPAVREKVALTDGEAIRTCEETLKRGMPVPSSFNRLLPSTGVYRAPGGDAVVTFDFNALNGLGFPLSMQVECLLDAREIARLEVNPR